MNILDVIREPYGLEKRPSSGSTMIILFGLKDALQLQHSSLPVRPLLTIGKIDCKVFASGVIRQTLAPNTNVDESIHSVPQGFS
jgi:hypothetical protein